MTTVVAEAPLATQAVERVEELGADRVLGEIKRNCFLMYITIHRWEGQYLIRDAEVSVDGKEVKDDLTTSPRWKLIPPHWHKRIQPIEGLVRKMVYRRAVSFKDGIYIVPKLRARDLIADIKGARQQYDRVVSEFVDQWPNIIEQLEQRIRREHGPTQWLAVSKLLPSSTKLRSLFGIEIGLWPVGGGSLPAEAYEDLERLEQLLDPLERLEAGLTGSDQELVEQCRNAVLNLVRRIGTAGKVSEEDAEEWVGEAKMATSRMVAEAVEAMIQDPIREFAEAVQNMTDLQNRNGVCRTGTIEMIRRAYDKLMGFSFLVPEDLVQRLTQVNPRLRAVEPRDINTQAVIASQLGSALRAISSELQEAAKNGGQLNRFLDF